MSWVNYEDNLKTRFEENGWTPYNFDTVDLKYIYSLSEIDAEIAEIAAKTEEIAGDMDEVLDCIWEESEEKYTLEIDNMLHMLVNDEMVIDEETGEEVYVDPFTFNYHNGVLPLCFI